MAQKNEFTCDVCKKPIKTDHQILYMGTVTIAWTETVVDGGISTQPHIDVYHVHNDMSNHCLRKLWDILEKK